MANKQTSKNPGFLSMFSNIKFGESYVSLVLGLIVVLFSSYLIFSFSKNIKKTTPRKDTFSQKTQEVSKENINTYVVKEGDNLWNISNKTYKSGYNWVDIAKANKLENPDLLLVGTKLQLPQVEIKIVKTKTKDKTLSSPQKGKDYKVQEGDCLWNIAVKAYGDGFKWVEIARVNKIPNPDLIYPDQIFKLPK